MRCCVLLFFIVVVLIKQSLSIQHVWTLTHQLAGKGCQCTGVDAKAPDVVSVGEDGSLNLLRIGVAHPLRTIG